MTGSSVKPAVMRQESFVARHQEEWNRFEVWLTRRGDSPREARGQPPVEGLRDEDMPESYRRLCQQLALARSRGYSPIVVSRLQALAQRGHAVLYRAPPPAWHRMLHFVLAEFPRLVRAQRGCLLAAVLLFVVPTVASYLAVQYRPELVYTMISPEQAAQFEQMYDPAQPIHKLGRESGEDLQMFGFYILNNISIGLRTFATGLFFAVGTIIVLIKNGLMLGVVASHLQAVGHGGPFWRFVPAHSAPELTAVVIAGAAGLQLGLALVAPGRRRRVDALIEAGLVGAKLCLGVFLMLVLAAFIEAFWSSIGWMPAMIKYAVGAVMWSLILGWLTFGGRGASASALKSSAPEESGGVDDAA